MFKRLKEIAERKLEIRGILASGKEVDLDAFEKELKDLETEEKELNRRQQILNGINDGTVPASSIPNPASNEDQRRKAENTDAEYRSAWLKHVRGIEMSDVEKQIFNEKRAMTTDAASAGAVIPTVTMNKIIEKVNQFCPLLEKIDLIRVPGGVTIPAEGTTADAAIHNEGETINASPDALAKVVLRSYEVTKLVTISKSVDRMSIDAFEAWIVNKISRKIGQIINGLIINGTGSNQAQGINAIPWTNENSVTVPAGSDLTTEHVRSAVALLNGGYDAGAEWLMSKATFMNDFHSLMDKGKNNIVTQEGRKYYILGYPVNWDERVAAHEAFLGDFYMGYVGNMPEEVTVSSQFVARENSFDFLGSAMFDGKVQAVEAFVKIAKAVS